MRGRVIAESLRIGAIVSLEHVELTSVGRHDVTAGTRLDGSVRAEDGAVAGQPSVWTFVDSAGSDDAAEEAARTGKAWVCPSISSIASSRWRPTLARRRHRNRRPGCAPDSSMEVDRPVPDRP